MNPVSRNILYSNKGAGLLALAVGISVVTLLASSASLLVQLSALKKLSSEQKAAFSDQVNRNTVVLTNKLLSLRMLQRDPKTLKWSTAKPNYDGWSFSSEPLTSKSNGKLTFGFCDPRKINSVNPNKTIPLFCQSKPKTPNISTQVDFNETRPDGTQKITVQSFLLGKTPRSLTSLIEVPSSYLTINITYQQFATGDKPRPTDCTVIMDPSGEQTLLGCTGQGNFSRSATIKVSPDSNACNTLRIMLRLSKVDGGILRDTDRSFAPNGQPEMNYMDFTKSGNSITGVLNDNEDINKYQLSERRFRKQWKDFADTTFTLTFPSKNFTIQNTSLSCN